MTDRITKQQRSKNMSHIKGKDTSIEVRVRKYLYHRGFRYRKNVNFLPGKPDIYLKKYNTVIFINGCFWHHHHNCILAYIPKTRQEYWISKFNRNIDNDIKNYQKLRQMDFKVIVVWECEIKECFEYRMKALIDEILEEKDLV